VKIISPTRQTVIFLSSQTPDFTFGGGIKTFSSTVKIFCIIKACTKTDKFHTL
jgi:hypothetical protein